MALSPLPIDPLVPEVLAALRRGPSVVLEAPPGAGKTTRVPSALLGEAGLAGEILVLQPRRLATRLAATRVASERGERVGDQVGYQVRFEDVSSERTRLRFITEGLLGRRLIADGRLRGVSAVVLDEFHERHLAGDIGLAMLRRLQQTTRPDLRLVVMSATLEAAPIAAYLGDCERLRSEGRRFEVTLEHLASADERPLEQQVLAALKRVVAESLDGDVLVFLPGASEIRRTREAIQELTGRKGLEVHTLHGDLSPGEQDRAVKPASRPKVILSTNVAETSVTIEGVSVVIDSGLARVASHSPWSGLPVLKLAKVSQASAIQRAGRAGRTREGRCLRLYTRGDFDGRPAQDTPEIRRADLTETVLALRATGVKDLGAFPFFEAPSGSALAAADSLLHRLGAITSTGEVTALGERILKLPLHPRQARVVVEAERRGVAKEGVTLAALLGERDVRLESRTSFEQRGRSAGRAPSGPSDLLDMLERFQQGLRVGLTSGKLAGLGLESGAAQAVDRVVRQLSRGLDLSRPRPPGAQATEDALMQCLLAGYPDRVAKRKRPHQPQLLLFGGGSATLAETSVVHEPELMVALDVEERPGRGTWVQLASQVEPEWLLELSHGIEEVDVLQFNAELERVERITRLSYGSLVLEETRVPAPVGEATASVLAAAALAKGIERFCDAGTLEGLRARWEMLANAYPEAGFPTLDAGFLEASLRELCVERRSFAELREAGLIPSLAQRLESTQARLLATHAPDKVTLPGGRTVPVHYEAGKPPWIESRLQDFFGLGRGPTVGGGRVPLVLHLLAPNQRSVQVTTDLAGFWERHYPSLRKELARKYPRHFWPEDPLRAQPPPPRPPRR